MTTINVGDVFGQLTIIRQEQTINTRRRFLCRCVCGKEKIILGQSLLGKRFRTKTCGCRAGAKYNPKTTHKLSYCGMYSVWHGMIDRCHNVDNPRYADYGGRGITVCDRWHDLTNFYTDMYPRPPRTTLDRIDNNKGYSPENCRWSTPQEQQRNSRRNHLLTWSGKTQCVQAWAEEIGTTFSNLNTRLMRGWTIERALTEPIHYKNK